MHLMTCQSVTSLKSYLLTYHKFTKQESVKSEKYPPVASESSPDLCIHTCICIHNGYYKNEAQCRYKIPRSFSKQFCSPTTLQQIKFISYNVISKLKVKRMFFGNERLNSNLFYTVTIHVK